MQRHILKMERIIHETDTKSKNLMRMVFQQMDASIETDV